MSGLGMAGQPGKNGGERDGLAGRGSCHVSTVAIGPRRPPLILWNEYGTPVSVHVCNACGTAFSVCPAVTDPAKWEQWEVCLDIYCPSYDVSRDAGFYFGLGMVERDAS